MTTALNNNRFSDILNKMKLHGMEIPSDKVCLNVEDAVGRLKNTMQHFVEQEGKKFIWLDEYQQVAHWLSNNQGLGLILHGNCGRGKSILGRFVLPAILLEYCNKKVSVFNVQEMNRKPDEVLKKHLISLDDVGTEEVSVKFGDRRMVFSEIVDAAEKHSKLLIVSSNLSSEQFRNRYGDRITDRLRAITHSVVFKGESLRGNPAAHLLRVGIK